MYFDRILGIFLNNWPFFLRGAINTIIISLIATIIGFVIGLVVGVLRTIPEQKATGPRILQKILGWLLSVYIEVFRGTPMMVQAMVIFYGVPLFTGVQLNRMLAAFFIVSINTGAYMAEVVRGGILSVDRGQYEAAKAVGMNHVQTMVHVVLPVAIRNILPATGNEFIINIKDTSVLNIIGVTELFFQSRTVAGVNFMFFETYFITSLIYLFMTFTITRILRIVERKMDGSKTYQLNQQQV